MEVREYRKLTPIKDVQVEDMRVAAELKWAGWVYNFGEGLPGQRSWFLVTSLEGAVNCFVGDYVAEGLEGEHHVIKREIFEATCELVGDA